MNISTEGLNLIKRFEGFSSKPYLCPAGRWTIGYGHMLALNETHAPISETLAGQWLVADVAFAEHGVRQLIDVALKQHQFDALTSFTYNLGTGVLQRSTLRRVINQGEEDAIAGQWMRWVWAGGRKLPGLAHRRAEELAFYLME